MAIPKAAQELLLDGLSHKHRVVTLNVSVQPKTSAVYIYLSEEDHHPLLCKGPQSQITVECRSGRIFVEKSDDTTSFQVSIVDRG